MLIIIVELFVTLLHIDSPSVARISPLERAKLNILTTSRQESG